MAETRIPSAPRRRPSKDERIALRASREQRELIAQASEVTSTTVSDFVLRSDTFRTYVDSYIRGAKMVAVNEHSDGVIETVMELKLEPRFRACVADVAHDQVQDLCPIPMPRDNDSIGDVQSKGVDSLYYLD